MGPFATSLGLAALALTDAVHARPRMMKRLEQDLALNPELEADKQVLLEFAATVTSDPSGLLANWSASPDPRNWQGIKVDPVPPTNYSAVSGINFNELGLGSNLRIDGFIDRLPDLIFFHANSNNFTGAVPNMSKSKYFWEFDISHNKFSGPFPDGILNNALTFLDIRFNDFSGPLPANLFTTAFKKETVDVIFVNNNKFSGTLPEMERPFKTRYATFANNQFTGPIPTSWGKWVGLREILLLNNDLSGTIPEELCDLARKHLYLLDVSYNPQLVGPVPAACLDAVARGKLELNTNGTGILSNDTLVPIGGRGAAPGYGPVQVV